MRAQRPLRGLSQKKRKQQVSETQPSLRNAHNLACLERGWNCATQMALFFVALTQVEGCSRGMTREQQQTRRRADGALIVLSDPTSTSSTGCASAAGTRVALAVRGERVVPGPEHRARALCGALCGNPASDGGCGQDNSFRGSSRGRGCKVEPPDAEEVRAPSTCGAEPPVDEAEALDAVPSQAALLVPMHFGNFILEKSVWGQGSMGGLDFFYFCFLLVNTTPMRTLPQIEASKLE